MGRNQKANLNILNIKLYSNERRGDEAYADLFDKIFRDKVSINVRGAHRVIIRRMIRQRINGELTLYGKISRFTQIEGTDWLNLVSLEREEIVLPDDVFPDLVETDFYFIPRAHRFAFVIKSGSVTLKNIEVFLENSINRVLSKGEKADIVTEQSSDGFDEILNAKEIKRIKVEISYSNADNYREAAALLDNQLKNSNTKDLILQAVPDHGENIDLDQSPVLSGAFELAKSNGSVESKIIDENNKQKIVKTKNYPKKIQVTATEVEDIKPKIIQRIIQLFR